MSDEALKTLAENAIKLAEQMKQRLVDNFVSVNPSSLNNLDKAAKALIESGWLGEGEADQQKVAQVLCNHDDALEIIHDLAVKSAAEIKQLRTELRKAGRDDRLESKARFIEEYTKKAEDNTKEARYVGDRIENEHDREFMQKVLSFREMLETYKAGGI